MLDQSTLAQAVLGGDGSVSVGEAFCCLIQVDLADMICAILGPMLIWQFCCSFETSALDVNIVTYFQSPQAWTVEHGP